MKKGSKLSEQSYEVEITDLSHTTSFKATSNSLRELIRMVQTYVPPMDTYSKVYREMRESLGAFMALYSWPLPGRKIRRVVVHITSAIITEADIERFHARTSTLPTLPEGLSFEEYIASIEAQSK